MSTQHKKQRAIRWLAAGLGVVLIICGGYGVYTFYFAKESTTTSIKQPAFTKSAVDPTKKTDQQKQAYMVPPSHPRQLIIKRLGIDTNILPVGTLSDTTLDAPKTAWDVGWYNKSALPGSGKDALLIDGHVNDSLDQPGIFYNIKLLQPGDTMQIQRGDMQLFSYRIEKVEQKPTAQVDMDTLLASTAADKEGLNLITCGGSYSSARQTYLGRVLVYAVRIE